MNKILFFAHLKEAIDKSMIEVDMSGKSIQQLRHYLEESTALGKMDGVMIAVNEEFVQDDFIIQENDEIALIPPVSGG